MEYTRDVSAATLPALQRERARDLGGSGRAVILDGRWWTEAVRLYYCSHKAKVLVHSFELRNTPKVWVRLMMPLRHSAREPCTWNSSDGDQEVIYYNTW